MSISRPALAKPTRSLRCSIEVDPNCVETTSSIACTTRSRSSPMSSSSSRLDCGGRGDVLAVGRLRAASLQCLTTWCDLGLGDPGALDAHRLAGAHRQEQPVALADQLLRARLVEDDPAVGQRRGRERQPRRHVGLDQAGDDVDRGPLGRQHQVDAGGPGELGDPDDRRPRRRAGATIIRSASSSTTTSR